MYSCFYHILKRKLTKFQFIFLLTFIASLFYSNLKAADGCYYGGVLYTVHTKSGKYFYNTPGNEDAACGVAGTISGSCRIYKGTGNLNSNASYNNRANAYSSNISVIPCPIDDEIWLLFFAVSLGVALKFRLIKSLNII